MNVNLNNKYGWEGTDNLKYSGSLNIDNKIEENINDYEILESNLKELVRELDSLEYEKKSAKAKDLWDQV